MSDRYNDEYNNHRGSYVSRVTSTLPQSSGSSAVGIYRRNRSRSRSRSRSPLTDDYNREDRRRHRRHESDSDNDCDDDDGRKLDDNTTRKTTKTKEEIRAPPPPRISKVSVAFGRPGTIAKPVQINLASAKKSVEPAKKITVAAAFNNDSDDDEPEEMPAECRMRMRNIGRDTPTSSGPNSFGKTKQGFCDAKKIFEKTLRDEYCD